jgi:hypothetical protein
MTPKQAVLKALEGVYATVEKGQVKLFKASEDGDDDSAEWDVVDLAKNTNLVMEASYVEPHPEGADRGGYVPCLEVRDEIGGHYKVFYYGDSGWAHYD